MLRIQRIIFILICSTSVIFAGPPPDVSMEGVPMTKPKTKGLRWVGFEYGWYSPSLAELNDKFENTFRGERIGTNDYLSLGIGLPTPGNNRAGFFFAYWDGGLKEGVSTLKLNMIILSGEVSFGIIRIPNRAIFSPGLIIRDVFGWWTFKSAGIDTTEFSLVMDIGAKGTAEYYPVKNIGIKLDFGWLAWGLDLMRLLGEDKIKLQTPGNILKLGVNFYY